MCSLQPAAERRTVLNRLPSCWRQPGPWWEGRWEPEGEPPGMTHTQAPPPSLISSLGVAAPGLAASLQAQSCVPSPPGDSKG